MMEVFGNIREMVTVQRRFLKNLEAAVESEGGQLSKATTGADFQVSKKTNSEDKELLV